MAILILNERDSRAKKIARDREGHSIMIIGGLYKSTKKAQWS